MTKKNRVLIEYDNYGRMLYHPKYHPNQGKPFTESELEYICKFHEVDELRTISFAIGRTEVAINGKIMDLKRKGQYEFYKNLNKHW